MTQSARGLSPNFSIRRDVRKPVVRSAGGIVASQNRLASEIGAQALRAGGHAVDAAIATAFAVGVLEPWMSGIGATGAMLIYTAADRKVTVVDFGARAPLALDPADYPVVEGNAGDLFGWPRVKDDRNLAGATAVAAPTMVAGAHRAHTLFGRSRWRDLVTPAIALAEEGPVVDWHTTLEVATAFSFLARDPGCRSIFLPGGAPPSPPPAVAPQPIMRLPNAALARTLGVIADEGPNAFYHGAIARALEADVRHAGGVMTAKDLAAVEARVVSARTVRHQAYDIHVLPELSGGPTIARAFDGLNRRWNDVQGGPLSASAFVAMAASLQAAWENRFENMGDTATTAPTSSTTHLSVVDRDGNMVALTQTLLSVFGSRFLSPSTGVLFNNAVNWFDPRPGGPNSMAPGKRALCNYCPAIMTGTDDTTAIGGSGGRKILSAVFQLLTMMANGISLDDAFHAPRIDLSGGDTVVVDRDLPADIRAALAAEFKTLAVERTSYPYHFTVAGAVRRVNGANEGATEPQEPWSEAVAEEEV